MPMAADSRRRSLRRESHLLHARLLGVEMCASYTVIGVSLRARALEHAECICVRALRLCY